MEQRPLRLGDLIDDYCPRERRVTNHAIVALVGDSIRQTRCTTCESEHEYKEGRMPRKKLKDGEAQDLSGGVLVSPKAAAAETHAAPAPAPAHAEPAPSVEADGAARAADRPAGDDDAMPDGWLAHRPLIRATLPRSENEAPAPRPIPEFTMHQRQGRGFGGRGGGFHRGFAPQGGNGNGRVSPPRFRDGQEPDGNRVGPPPGAGGAPGAPGAPGGGKSRHRRRHRRPR